MKRIYEMLLSDSVEAPADPIVALTSRRREPNSAVYVPVVTIIADEDAEKITRRFVMRAERDAPTNGTFVGVLVHQGRYQYIWEIGAPVVEESGTYTQPILTADQVAEIVEKVFDSKIAGALGDQIVEAFDAHEALKHGSTKKAQTKPKAQVDDVQS